MIRLFEPKMQATQSNKVIRAAEAAITLLLSSWGGEKVTERKEKPLILTVGLPGSTRGVAYNGLAKEPLWGPGANGMMLYYGKGM